ncbi:MAG TPA: VOC family protein [Alphaproteobacteria bacterium]|nr:VOC family protein [Alphaproteobacteria bacterium]
MEQRLTLVTLGVADLDRARAFYDALGWQRSVKAAEGVAFYQAGSIAFSLYPRGDLTKDAGVDLKGSGFPGFALAHNVRSREQVDATLKEAEAAGGKVIKPAEEAFWGGYSGYFSDPDGFLWEVAWNPGFALTDDGAVILPD